MTPRAFCQSGEAESLKGAVHALGGLLAASMAAYNIVAWCYRRERHLAANGVLYTLATIWEVEKVRHHLEEHG